MHGLVLGQQPDCGAGASRVLQASRSGRPAVLLLAERLPGLTERNQMPWCATLRLLERHLRPPSVPAAATTAATTTTAGHLRHRRSPAGSKVVCAHRRVVFLSSQQPGT